MLGWALTLLLPPGLGWTDSADAKITRIVISTTAPAFDGTSFGAVGPYEQLDGTA
jgi:hypothetical protein